MSTVIEEENATQAETKEALMARFDYAAIENRDIKLLWDWMNQNRHMTTQELADAAGVHVQTLKRLEGGSGAGYETVKALEKALRKQGARWEETEDGVRLTVDLRDERG